MSVRVNTVVFKVIIDLKEKQVTERPLQKLGGVDEGLQTVATVMCMCYTEEVMGCND